MNTNNEYLREEFEKEFHFLYDHGYAVHENQEGREIADWWLARFAADRAELIEKLEEIHTDLHNGYMEAAYKKASDFLLRHTGEDNQNER